MFGALLLLAIAAYAVVRFDLLGPGDEPPAPHCVVTGPDGEVGFTMQPEQAANAATIGAVGSARGLPERAVAIALATAMQESRLRNIDYGDRDSLGLFQQRPSQGWGTAEQIMDPVYAAGRFYDSLVEVPDYESLPLTEAAQAVQRSAYPDAYAQHEDEALLLASALTGRRAAALNCVVAQEPVPGRPGEAAERIERDFGGQVPVTAEGDVVVCAANDTDQADGAESAGAQSAGAEGGAGGDEPCRGWELAHWAVAHAAELGIRRIDYGDRVWEAERSADGWRRLSDEEGDEEGEEAADADDGSDGRGAAGNPADGPRLATFPPA